MLLTTCNGSKIVLQATRSPGSPRDLWVELVKMSILEGAWGFMGKDKGEGGYCNGTGGFYGKKNKKVLAVFLWICK